MATWRAALVALLAAAALTACGGTTDEDRAGGAGESPASPDAPARDQIGRAHV